MSFSCVPSRAAELAASVEEEGIAFYRLLAERSKSGFAKDVFLFLSKQESAHRQHFLKMAEVLKGNEKEHEFPIDIEQLLCSGIEQLKTAVFSLSNVPADLVGLKKNLDIAIHTEAESVKLYTALTQKFPETFTPVLDRIIAEETKHLDDLLSVKDRLGF